MGEYVMPVAAAPGAYSVLATCEVSSASAGVMLGASPAHADLFVGNSAPQVVALNLSKGGTGVRRADPADFDGASNKAVGAQFLPFDVGSFHYDTDGDPHAGFPNAAAVQEQFRQLNKLVLDTTTGSVQPGYQQLMDMWYPGAGGVTVAGHLFSFTNGAAQLSGTPFSTHEPLYDAVVAPVCRTCHISHGSSDNWTSFGQMNNPGMKAIIQGYACGTGDPATQSTFTFAMPHAEVPFKKFWNDSLASTLSSQLSLAAPGCPNN